MNLELEWDSYSGNDRHWDDIGIVILDLAHLILYLVSEGDLHQLPQRKTQETP